MNGLMDVMIDTRFCRMAGSLAAGPRRWPGYLAGLGLGAGLLGLAGGLAGAASVQGPSGLDAAGPAAHGSLKLARPFTHNAVLQRGCKCPVFGVDLPGTSVTVTFAGQSRSTRAGPDGDWLVELEPLSASCQPGSMTVNGSATLVLTNLLVGEVWLIAGQSNADWPLAAADGGPAFAAAATNSLIRYLHLAEAPRTDNRPWSPGEVARLRPETYFSGAWTASDPVSARDVSAIGYWFAHHLATNLDVPIGLIDCTVGGTPLESWLPPEAIASHPRLRAIAEHFLESDRVPAFVKTRVLRNLAEWDAHGRPEPMPEHPYKPGACWRLGLGTVAPFALRGLLWYQGETNADFYDFDYGLMARWHTEAFEALVAAWRTAWRQPSLPVCFVQLPRLNRPSWPWFRESQLQCARAIPKTAMAVAFDLGDPANVHPSNKRPVADRLARIARARVYGQDLECSGPVFRRQRVEGSRIVLEFDHVAGGLVSSDGQPLRLFEIAGADRRFLPAEAVVVEHTVVVSSPAVAEPVAVRFAWVPSGELNFFNAAGLPASPFRTDRWITTHRPVRVACIGDSITFGHGLDDPAATYPARLQQLLGPDYAVRNFGRSGCTVTRDSTNRWPRGYVRQPEHTNALAFHPDVVICNLGINDVSTFADPHRRHFVRDYVELIRAYRALPTAPRILLWQPLAPLFPGQTYHGQPVVEEVNRLIRQAADLTGADTLDLWTGLKDHPEWFPDHLHPNADGARRIAEIVRDQFARLVEPGISFGP